MIVLSKAGLQKDYKIRVYLYMAKIYSQLYMNCGRKRWQRALSSSSSIVGNETTTCSLWQRTWAFRSKHSSYRSSQTLHHHRLQKHHAHVIASLSYGISLNYLTMRGRLHRCLGKEEALITNSTLFRANTHAFLYHVIFPFANKGDPPLLRAALWEREIVSQMGECKGCWWSLLRV